MKLRALLAAFLAISISIQAALSMQQASAFPLDAGQSLPPGSELNEDALDSPRELFHSEQIGGRKNMPAIGDLFDMFDFDHGHGDHDDQGQNGG